MASLRLVSCQMALVVMASTSGVGCAADSAHRAPAHSERPIAVDDDESTADLTEHHRYHHHGGAMLFIAMSLDTLGASSEQRVRLQKIQDDLYARLEPARVAEQKLAAMLADGVAAGSLDAAQIDASVAQVTEASAAVHDESAAALNELHAILTPTQRGALVDKIESHWQVWKRANAQESNAPMQGGDQLEQLASELGLTADQEQRIRAGLGAGVNAAPQLDPSEMTAHLREFGEAFRRDAFDASTLRPGSAANAHVVGWGAAHMAHFIEVVAPVLTPDQRTTLAQRLRDHATHNPSAQAKP